MDQKIVALKIMDIDSSDYRMNPAEKDEAIKDFIKETSILQTLKEAKARNINTIYDAFDFPSQLWIVSEYCPGGSVHTLMKASKPGPGLAERYIIAISRELAIALKHVHEVHVIHRDVKAANILITESGQLQLCDFGVSGALESNASKRSTIIGTPFWMAPEMHNDGMIPNGYGTEVDCWAFGCTVYELATGLPPNARIHPRKLGIFLQKAPVLEGDQFSNALKEFVAFCLEERPERRPSATAILNHPYIRDSAERYPTIMLKELIEEYARWESSGGQRASLFNPYGAQGPSPLDFEYADDEWNFSTTPEFDDSFFAQESLTITPNGATTEVVPRSRQGSANFMNPFDRSSAANAAIRGGSAMAGIFNPDANPYSYTNGDGSTMDESSDLPLRKFSADQAANRLTMIDLDLAITVEAPSVDLADVPTIKSKKNNFIYDADEEEDLNASFYNDSTAHGTNGEPTAWTFPPSITAPANPPSRPLAQNWTMESAFQEAELATQTHSAHDTLLSAPTPKASQPASFRPTLTHSVTEPLGAFNDFMHPFDATRMRLSNSPDRYSSLLDLDVALIPRPSTAASTATDFTDVTTGDPWDLDQDQDTDQDIKAMRNRQSFHVYSQSDPTYLHDYENHHDRGGSMSSDTDFERGRPLSVKASADSLRIAMDEEEDNMMTLREEYWESNVKRQFQSRTRRGGSRLESEQSKPLLSAPLDGAFDLHSWSRRGSDTISAGLPDRDLTVRGFPRVEEHRFTSSFPTTSEGWSGSTLRSRHNSRGRRGLVINPGDRTTVEGFPEPRGPDPAALEEDASNELVIMELERLLGNFSKALRISGELLVGGEMNGKIAEERMPGVT